MIQWSNILDSFPYQHSSIIFAHVAVRIFDTWNPEHVSQLVLFYSHTVWFVYK
jgi:hypothetical protein